jgi:hypothetical protein
MRIVNRKEFLKLPSGTVYCKGERWYWEQITVKRESLDNDWYYLQLDQIPCQNSNEWLYNSERMLETGESMPIQIVESRDGCFEDDAVFLIYENSDMKVLKEYLETY